MPFFSKKKSNSDLQKAIYDRLAKLRLPGSDHNIVDEGLVSPIHIQEGCVTFSLNIPRERAEELEPLSMLAEREALHVEGVDKAIVTLTSERDNTMKASQPQQSQQNPLKKPKRNAGPLALDGVSHMIAVASGKGGVGKSTTSVNLALALQKQGLSVGLVDADVYGPSIPTLLGLKTRPHINRDKKISPLLAHGLKFMSMGLMVDDKDPVVWRAPIVTASITQMTRDVDWGELDVLILDLPPGTGDVQLTIAQQLQLTGAVIVSTPQDLALLDARKGLNMFKKVNIPVMGLVENMSTFICPSCGTSTSIFGCGGAEQEAQTLGIPFLGAIPLHMHIRETSDQGKPIVVSSPDSQEAQAYIDIANHLRAHLDGKKPKDLPKIIIE